MQIYWNIRFLRIRFVLSCFVFLYALLVIYESYVKIKHHHKKSLKTVSYDISCYYKDKGDETGELPTEKDLNFSPKKKSIFFIDATCRGKFSMLQACVIESAALTNPDWNIYLLYSFPITDLLGKTYLAELLTYPNVKTSRIHIAEYAKDTVLESLLVDDLKKSKNPIEDTTNILKIVTLYKWGGITLDDDMLMLKSIGDLPKNWVVKNNKGVSSGIFSFAKDDVGRNFTSEIMNELAKTYIPEARHFNILNTILFRLLKRLCPNVLTSKSEECNGLSVLSEDLFNPIRIPEPKPYAEDIGAEEYIEDSIPYTFHLKNMDYSSYRTSEEWPSDGLARIFCPGIFKHKLNVNKV